MGPERSFSNDSEWHLVRNRVLDKGQIFKSADGTRFLRVGTNKIVHAEVEFSRSLKQRGFPVPIVIDVGEIEGAAYFIEQSLGNETFGRIFSREFAEQGAVSDEFFKKYCAVTRSFLAAQLNNAVSQGVGDIYEHIHLANVTQENPDLDNDTLYNALSKIAQRTSHLPHVLTHGDFTPFNILEGGVIDFEHSFISPVGYDILTNVIYGRLWDFRDATGKSRLSYDFNDKQIRQYRRVVEHEAAKYGVDELSSFTDDFVLLKAIWALAEEKSLAIESGDDTKWRFRRSILAYCLEQYISGGPIDTKKFGQLSY